MERNWHFRRKKQLGRRPGGVTEFEQGWRSEFAGRVEGARPKRSQTKAWNAKQNR